MRKPRLWEVDWVAQGQAGVKQALKPGLPRHLSQCSLLYNSLQDHQACLLSLLMKNKDKWGARFIPGHSESPLEKWIQALALSCLGFFGEHSIWDCFSAQQTRPVWIQEEQTFSSSRWLVSSQGQMPIEGRVCKKTGNTWPSVETAKLTFSSVRKPQCSLDFWAQSWQQRFS